MVTSAREKVASPMGWQTIPFGPHSNRLSAVSLQDEPSRMGCPEGAFLSGNAVNHNRTVEPSPDLGTAIQDTDADDGFFVHHGAFFDASHSWSISANVASSRSLPAS